MLFFAQDSALHKRVLYSSNDVHKSKNRGGAVQNGGGGGGVMVPQRGQEKMEPPMQHSTHPTGQCAHHSIGV